MNKDWIEVEIHKLGEIITGGTPLKKDSSNYDSNDYPFYKPTDLNQGINTLESNDHLSEKAFFNSRKAPKNSILVTCIGATIGKTGLIKKEGAFNQQINAIIPFEFVDNKFLFYQIISQEFQNRIKDNSSSTTLPILNKSKFSILPSKLAPFPEQRAIVARIEELFSDLDQAIANLKSAQAKLEIYRQAVLKKAFDGGFTMTPTTFKSVELKSVVIKISDGPFGSNLKTADYKDEGVRVIRLENIGVNEFRDEFRTYVSDEKYEFLKRHSVGSGDIIFSSFISESIRAVVLPIKINKAINKADCFLIRVDETLINRKFLIYYFLTKYFYNQLVNQVHGATRPRINTTQLKSTILPMCDLIVQEKIVQEIESRLSVADKLAETIQTNLQKSESLRQSILKKAFEGKLLTEAELVACRKEADWEPAEKLLERIKGEKKKK